MTKLSPHFSRSEFACGCGCGFDTVDSELVDILERVRHYFNAPILITSGCRCEKFNRKILGSDKSQHILARAADFQVQDVHPADVYHWIDEQYNGYGLGLYDSWVHLDTRNTKARWRR